MGFNVGEKHDEREKESGYCPHIDRESAGYMIRRRESSTCELGGCEKGRRVERTIAGRNESSVEMISPISMLYERLWRVETAWTKHGQ
jgi:hypothetical protein